MRTVTGGRHLHVGIRTKLGAEFDMAINRGKVDPHKQIGWVRQRMRRADATLKKRK